jgi:hypothetical protein
MDTMRRAGIEEAIQSQHFYLSVQAGVDAYLADPAHIEQRLDEERGGPM